MRDRYDAITLAGRRFQTVVAADDPHDWSLLDPTEQAEFDEAWEQMRVRLGYAPVAAEIAA